MLETKLSIEGKGEKKNNKSSKQQGALTIGGIPTLKSVTEEKKGCQKEKTREGEIHKGVFRLKEARVTEVY